MSSFEQAAGVSATDDKHSGGTCGVTFRVRCETLGHGEAIFLVPDGTDVSITFQGTPLFTSPKTFPWYSMSSPKLLTLPASSVKKPTAPPPPTNDTTTRDSITRGIATTGSSASYKYRYAVFRAGEFHRWENPSDGPSDTFHGSHTVLGVDGYDPRDEHPPHILPLRLFVPNEDYIVGDVLGVTRGTADIEKIKVRDAPALPQLSDLHARSSSGALKNNSGRSMTSLSRLDSASGERNSSYSVLPPVEKKVGFAPTPSPYHRPSARVSQRSVNLSNTDGLVVASAFLPVHLHRSDDGVWTADWDYEALLSMQTHLRVTRVGTVKWRGWHGNFMPGRTAPRDDELSPEFGVPVEERGEVERCLRPFNCVPVWCDASKFGEMYNGFCKGVLWPIFHNVTSVYSNQTEGGGASVDPLDESRHPAASEESEQYSEYCLDDVAFPIHGDGGQEATLWSAYTEVNRKFADTIIQCFNEGDLVWIHGFHLLILPSILTRRIPMAKIGIFLHTPFPSSEIFRTLWCREDLLRGMLNADQVGFHLFEYGRHFLTCCRRLLGLNYGMIPDSYGGHNLAIEVNGRHVTVTSIHAGIETDVYNNVLMQNLTIRKATTIQNQFQGKVIFCAIDRMESLKGIPLKLLGLERFLLRCPEWVGKIVLVQVGISAFERGDDYFKTKSEVLKMVTDINRCWPGTVQFQECKESEMRMQQRISLLRASDVVLVTPLRDGLNLIPLEFTISHRDALTEQGRRDGRQRGLCILSEFSSCTRVMRGALHVNPWKISEIANAFHQAVTMSEDERMRRVSTAWDFVRRVTTQRWALAVMLDLKGVYKNLDVGRYSGAGLGLGFRLLGMDTGFDSLDVGDVAKVFKNSKNRLILLDYGGTILKNDNMDSIARYQMVNNLRAPSVATKEMISAIDELCSDTRNTVFVVSGKERHALTKALGHIPNLGLAAEHGMFISWPVANIKHRRQWTTLVPDQDNSWRSIAISIMEVYTSRTHGSYIEETEMKVLWQYRDADPEFGYLQSRELEDHLSNVLKSFSVDVLHGGVEEGGYVEVRPKGVNKGVAAMHIIRTYEKFQSSRIDFALAIGDDHCDEPMLSVMRSVGRRVMEAKLARKQEPPLPPPPATVTLVDVSACDDFVSPDMETFTCTVGKKPSAAKNYLSEVDDVQELLDALNKITVRSSFSDLRMLNIDDGNVIPVGVDLPADHSETICAGIIRSASMGGFGGFGSKKACLTNEEPMVSQSLGAYMGNLQPEEEDDDDDIFF